MTTDPVDAGPRPRKVPGWQAALAFGLLAALYSAVSIQQYNRMDSYIFDLGFFEAIVRDYAAGHLPVLNYTDTVTAPLHFSPALALLAPLVLVVPSPLTLLVAQAVLVAAGVVPLMRSAGTGVMPWVVAASYGLAPGFAALIGFDFHDVALAVPLLAFSMAAMLRADHRAAVLWALPLVLVKEDLGLTVAALGAVVFLRGSRRLGLATMLFGAVTFLVLVGLVLPAIQEPATFSEQYAPGSPTEAVRILTTAMDHKLRTVLFLLIPTGFVALRAPMLLIVALPTYGWRFVSDRTTYWEPWFHYDAVLVPIAVAAMIEGLRRLRGWGRGAALGAILVGTIALLPQMPFSQAWSTEFWRTPPRTAAVDRVLDRIPDGSRVAASDTLGGRIALRTEIYVIGDTVAADGPPTPASDFDGVEWIAVDTLVPYPPTAAWRGFVGLLDGGDFVVVAEGGGVVVAQRRSD